MKRLLLASIPVIAWQGYVFSLEHSDAYRRPTNLYQRAPYNIYNVTYSSLATLRDHRHPHLGEATGSSGLSGSFATQRCCRLPLAEASALDVRFGKRKWKGLRPAAAFVIFCRGPQYHWRWACSACWFSSDSPGRLMKEKL